MARRTPTKAEREARFDEALTTLPDNYLQCRDMRHAWRVTEDYHVSEGTPTRIREIRRVLTCLRCPVQRVEKYLPTKSRGLDKTGQTYRYPKGDGPDEPPRYQIPGVARGNKRSSLIHSEQYRRYLERTAQEVTDLGEARSRRRTG